MGRDVSLASNVIINAGYQGIIEIGNDVMIGPNTVLRSSDHGFSSIQIPMRNQPHRSGSIQISSDVWLGANVTVVGGGIDWAGGNCRGWISGDPKCSGFPDCRGGSSPAYSG